MPNMQKNKTPTREQNPHERIKNFKEVDLGYTPEMAMAEAERCLQCKHRPCVAGCPVNIDIPEFLSLAAKGDFEGAYQKIAEQNTLPAICGRVCPQESQCERVCVRGIKGQSVAIGRLERFCADWHLNNSEVEKQDIKSNGKKVAVIGAGPGGLTCAGELAKNGYDVTVFEAFHIPGGVLVYGIPEFRLPKSIVKREIDNLKALGVKIETNMVVGKIVSVDELFEQGFLSIYIGTGAGLPGFLNIEGENLPQVYSANEFLTRVNLMKSYDENYDTPITKGNNIIVIGGGNVAMDAARCAKRLGAENVYIVYRRSMEELPARAEEVEHAKEEGIEFKLLTNPLKILSDKDGNVGGMECLRMQLGEPDSSGRRRPVVIDGSNFVIDCDMVVIAIGQSPNPLIKMTTPDLETNKWGCIVTKSEFGETNKKGVYAGGDVVSGAATVILAMGAGKKAAEAMDNYMKNL